MLDSYLDYLLATLVIELGLLMLICPGNHRRDALFAALAVNLFTHPLATMAIAEPGPLLGFWSAEVLVVLVEAIALFLATGLDLRRAIQLSLIVNGATILCAILLQPALVFGPA